MVQAYRTDNPWSGVAQGYGLGNALRDDVTRSRAGAAIAGGDISGGANALLANGNIESGLRVQDYGQRQQASAVAAKNAAEQEGLKFTADVAGRLAEVHRSSKDVNTTLAQFDAIAPQLAKYDTPDEIATLRQQIAADPDNTLLMLGAGAAKKAGLEVRNVGDEVLVIDPSDGRVVNRYRGARTINVGEGDALYELPGDGAGSVPAPQAEDAGAAVPSPAAAPASASDVEAVWQAAIQQESGGRAGILGPQTDYGRAEGLTQMLPATAEAMARKLGVAWNPALMRENSPKARAYQEKLGRAYFEEGLEKYGNVEDALRYYHGGPNQQLWGPKTEKHVQAVMSRVQPYEVAANGPTPPPPSGGARLIVSRPKREEGPEWTADGKGLLINKNGDRKADPAFAGSPEAGKVTEAERTAGFLSSRLADSLTNLTDINGRSPDAGQPGILETAAERAPWVGGQGAANLVRDADRQQVIANQLDILDAALTLGTGAAYTREQLENYRATYFPVLTDKPETVTAKRQKLVSLLSAAKIKAGRSAPPQLDVAIEAAKKQFGMGAPAGQGGVREVSTPAEAQALPPGTKFRTPDGQIRVRK